MGRGDESLIAKSRSHDQDGKNYSKTFFSRTGGPISMKLGM